MNKNQASSVKFFAAHINRPLSVVLAMMLIVSVSSVLFGNSFLLVAHADSTPQSLPFAQNWTNKNLITVDDNWDGVPGIVGYRGDGLAAAIPSNPQTVLADGSATPIDVNANRSDPDTFISGGISEFELADPVVALQGSATAQAPHLVISVNTTGQAGVGVSYKLRDVDGSADNSVQPVALQYRVGSSGNYTNIPSAFVADASSGPSLATLVTPVSIVLPSACDNQPLVQLRIITTNATGSDEWIGVDDIQIGSGGTAALSGNGAASPSLLNAGDTTLLTVAVSPASNPSSSGVTVTGNLSGIGGSATQTFFDDGTNGDAAAGDNVFSFTAVIPASVSGGAKTVPVSIADAQNRTAAAPISLTVRAAANPAEHLLFGNPSNAVTDVNQPLNYLLPKNQYALSYNRDLGRPNWVSWHLDSTWLGSAPRQDDFRADPSLPDSFYKVQSTDFSGSGFDRGHHTPSGDRTSTVADNSATFFMTNMMAQAPDNNQGPWEELESYCRTLVGQGNELYIVTGSVGQGGMGSNGSVTQTLASGRVSVPAQTWKVIIVLPAGDNDVSRVTNTTQTIAVVMPNAQGIRNTPWQSFQTSVDRVESLTGYNFFSSVPVNIQNVIEAVSPNAPPPPSFFDFDGDARADLSVTRSSGNDLLWYTQNTKSGLTGTQFGLTTDKLIPGDYDGDGKKDIAVVRTNTNNTLTAYILQSRDGLRSVNFGTAGDIFVPADYDGDGRTDLGVYRVAANGQGQFIYTASATQADGVFTVLPFGTTGDKPVVGDYDGDGRADVAVVRNNGGNLFWYVNRSRDGFTGFQYGVTGDTIITADYDGDGKTDPAVIRTSNGNLFWYIQQSKDGFTGYQYGVAGDVPVPADYDGDGKTDAAVTRLNGANLFWYIQQSKNGFTGYQYGVTGDKAVENAYIQ